MPRSHLPGPGPTAVAVMAGLGVVAAVRRAREARAERLGVLTRLGPDGPDDLPDGRPSPSRLGAGLDARVANWDPPRALDLGTRTWQAAWTAPATVAGLGVATLGGGTIRWDPGMGAWLATGVGGPSAFLLRRAGMSANTIGQTVVCPGNEPSQRLLDHEAVHVRQFERLGVAMYPLYLWFSARHGYRENPLEVGARRGAARRAVERDPLDPARVGGTVSRTRPGAAPAR